MENKCLVQLKIERIHVAPRALELSPPGVQKRFTRIWAPLEELLDRLRPLPAGLLHFWLKQPDGHVIITHLPSRYEPGQQTLKRHVLRNVAYVSVADLARDSLDALVPVGYLLDHLLGSAGADSGRYLSDGGGVNPALRQVGMRVAELFALGYGFDEAARSDLHTYWARSVALYLHDRDALNVADPLIEKLLRTTIFSPGFWRPRKQREPPALRRMQG